MILVDTSVWVDHLRNGNSTLSQLLERAMVLGHPFVTGELALGNLSRRAELLRLLGNLPQSEVATTSEVAAFIESRRLHGLGIGYVDAHLLAAARLNIDALLWTLDRALAAVAQSLELGTGLGGPSGGSGPSGGAGWAGRPSARPLGAGLTG